MVKLTKLDLDLLAELERDSNQTISQIAKKLKTSQQLISYKIKALENRKIIAGYYSIIDITKLGYTNYRTMIRLGDIEESKQKELINFLRGHKNVLWLAECGGRWDLIINFMARNIICYNDLLREFLNKFSKQIQDYDVLTTVYITYFGRSYFNNKSQRINFPSFSKRFTEIKIDKTNLKILEFISENSRINSVEIAYKLNLSPNTVLSRIKKMKKEGIIQGAKPLIHLENMGYQGYKALIKLNNISLLKEKDLINYLRIKRNVVGIVRLIGSWDFEIEFEVKDNNEMLKLTKEIRDKFKEIIKEFEVIPLFHEYRYNFFPGDLLN